MNLATLWLAAWRLGLGPWILRLGACSFWPLIVIRGPNLVQALLMILSSVAMVRSCGPDACATSIVKFFMNHFLSGFDIYVVIVVVSWRLKLEAWSFFLQSL